MGRREEERMEINLATHERRHEEMGIRREREYIAGSVAS